MDSPVRATLLFLVLFFAVASFTYIPRHHVEIERKAQLANVLSGGDRKVSLDKRTKTSDCLLQGALPDHGCTPGAIFAEATLERICVSGYTKTVRNVSTTLRKKVFAEYGVPYREPRGAYEVDHLIPLAIGGNNDIANLFPEPVQPFPGFREKDVVEVYLREEVCADRVALSVAQESIARDWLSIFNNIPQETITRIKAKYRNWSN